MILNAMLSFPASIRASKFLQHTKLLYLTRIGELEAHIMRF